MATREQAVNFLKAQPYKLGHKFGFTDLTEMHNKWIIDMLTGREDKTLQAHRGSYKTTCVSVALVLILILLPNKKTLFLRKTDNDIKEVISQVKNILESRYVRELVQIIYGVDLQLQASANEISTNLSVDIRGTAQLVGLGTGGSLTGKHFDRIFTDDIVNVQDRMSRAERERTKVIYQELRNIINRGGRIYNTGTPWHKEDAFTLMPNAEKYDCYSTGLIDRDTLKKIRQAMSDSLFAANYELKHIADKDAMFKEPRFTDGIELIYGGAAHIDAAYGGEDRTAYTIFKQTDGGFIGFGRRWERHVDDCLGEIEALHGRFRAGSISCERNADKGYLAKELRKRGFAVNTYSETMNKFLKISSYLRSAWRNILWLEETDPSYIGEILDYNEFAAHDDCPDSAASLIRRLENKTAYNPVTGGI